MANDSLARVLAIAAISSGGGGGGTTNYNNLSNKPQINNVTLSGNLSENSLGLASGRFYACTYNVTTYVMIGEALTASKIPYVVYNEQLYIYVLTSSDSYIFKHAGSEVVSDVSSAQIKLNSISVASNNSWTLNAATGATIYNTVDNLSSFSTTQPLSANMGKALNDRINNLENIGRFLAIWNSSTGLPLTNPTTMPYAYKTGDYYRVGTVGTTNYKPTGSSYNNVASTTVETNSVAVGDVYYYDGTNWLVQAAGAGGTVQDVQINGTSIIDSGTGVANIPNSSSSASGVMTSLQYTKLDGIQVGAITLTERVSGQSYSSGVFTYVAED